MTYNEWVSELKNNLLSVSESERSRVLAYYAEAYADRREAGFSERQIIEEFGAPYDAAQRILCETDDLYSSKQEAHDDKQSDVHAHTVEKHSTKSKVQQKQPKSGKKHVWLAVVLSIVAVIVVLALVGVTVLFALNSWNIFEKVNWESKTYECPEVVDTIDLDFAAGELVIQRYDGYAIKVDYSHSNKFTTAFTVTGSKLSIATSNVHWYNTFLWFNRIPTTTLYIPRNQTINLDMEINAGHVTVDDGSFGNLRIELNAGAISFGEVTCNDFNLELNAGALSIDRLSCTKFNSEVSAGSLDVFGLSCNVISVEVSAGSANLTVLGNKEDYTVITNVSGGRCNLKGQVGKENPIKRITVKVSAGSANIFFEAPSA